MAGPEFWGILCENHIYLLSNLLKIISYHVWWSPSLQVAEVHSWTSSFNIVFNEGDLSVPGDIQQCSKYGYIIWNKQFYSHATYHVTMMGFTEVMNIWNIDPDKEEKYLTWAQLYNLMSVSNRLSYLIIDIMLSSRSRVTIIFAVKFKINYITFTILDSFQGELNWNMNTIIPSHYVINILYYTDYVKDNKVFQIFFLDAITQIFSILRHLVSKISLLEFDAYHVFFTDAKDLKLLWAVYLIYATTTELTNWALCTTFLEVLCFNL